MKLSNEDGRAVDLLLDRTAASGAEGNGGSGVFVAAADGVGRERVHAAEKVLSLLKWMPAQEPPADLLARTMDRVDRHFAHVEPPRLQPPVMTSQRPHA